MVSPPLFRPIPLARRALWPVLSLTLVACGGTGADSQVAVRVNKGEISVHQVQAVLQRQPRQLAGEANERATGRVLEVLVDQELAAQAAASAGLDKDPRNVQLLEAARRELLARSYQERVGENAGSPSSDEIDQYYDRHPELFAQRRLYVLRETAVDPSVDAAALQALADSARSPDDLEKGLRALGARFNGRMLANAAEDLPMSLLGKLAPLEPGQSVLVPAPGAPRVFTVLQAIRAPVDRRTAGGVIGSFITNERKAAAVAQAMQKLRAESRVEYLGAFAKAASAPAPGPQGKPQ